MSQFSAAADRLLLALGWSRRMLGDRRFPICMLEVQYVPARAIFLVVYKLRYAPISESVGSIEDKTSEFPSPELLASLALIAGPVHDIVEEEEWRRREELNRSYHFQKRAFKRDLKR